MIFVNSEAHSPQPYRLHSDGKTNAMVIVDTAGKNSHRACKAADPCLAGEVCVDNTGGLCTGGTAKCALPCPNPL